METNKMAAETGSVATKDHATANMSEKEEERSKKLKEKTKKLDLHRNNVEQRAREKGILKVLNEQFLREEYEVDQSNVDDIDIVTLSKRNIELLDDFALMLLPRLKVCNLANNFLADISPLRVCTQLVKLDVSNNQIGALPDRAFWSGFTHLVVLYLHGNNLAQLSEVSFLGACLQLQVLTLCDTPVSLHRSYRHTTVNTIPSLKALDCFVISDEEIVENLSLSGQFAPLCRTLGISLYQPSTQSATCASELHQITSLLARVNAIMAKHSPVLIIQRYARGWLTRRRMGILRTTPSRKPFGVVHQHSRHLVSSALPLTGPASVVKERRGARGSPLVSQDLVSDAKSPGVAQRAAKQRLPRRTTDSGAVPAMSVCPSPSPPKMAADGAGPAKSGVQQRHIRIPIPGDTQQLGDSSSNSLRVHYGSVESVSKKPHGHHMDDRAQQQHPKTVGNTTKNLAVAQGQRALGHPLADVCEKGATAAAWVVQGGEGEQEAAGREQEEAEWKGELVGSAAQVQFYNPKKAIMLSRKLDGHLVRKAQAEIMSMRAAQTVPRIPPSCHLLMKDDLDFRRVHDSVNFAALQTVEKAYRGMEKRERTRVQEALVSRKQALRKEIKEKIEEHHRKRHNEVAQWKQAHSKFLARAREQLCMEGDLKASLHCGDKDCQRMLNMERKAEEGFVFEFSGINSSVENSLKQEDNRLLREGQQEERVSSVQQLRRSNFITRAAVLSQQQEKAEAARLRSADLRHELKQLKHKKMMDQYTAAKQKVDAVKHSLPPRTSRETHKFPVNLDRNKGERQLPPTLEGEGEDTTCSVDPSSGAVGPKLVTLSLEDCDVPTGSAAFLSHHSLPPGRILRHYSFKVDGNEEGEKDIEPVDLGPGLYGVFGPGHTDYDALGVVPPLTILTL